MKESPVTFQSKGKQLIGMLHLPIKKNPPIIIMCHGWAGGKTEGPHFLFVKTARFLCKGGFAVLRFDHAGVGDSEGDFEDYNTTSSLNDIKCAIDFVTKRKNINPEKIGLLGHSMGGMNAIITAARNKNVKCVVSWSGVANEKMMIDHWMLEQWKSKKFLILDGFKASWNSLKDDLKYDALKFARKASVPILIVNGDEDENVRAPQAYALYKACKKPKKLLIIRGADHDFLVESHQKILFRESLSWFNKWMK